MSPNSNSTSPAASGLYRRDRLAAQQAADGGARRPHLVQGHQRTARRMGGAKAIPINGNLQRDGFREGLNPSYALRAACMLALPDRNDVSIAPYFFFAPVRLMLLMASGGRPDFSAISR